MHGPERPGKPGETRRGPGNTRINARKDARIAPQPKPGYGGCLALIGITCNTRVTSFLTLVTIKPPHIPGLPESGGAFREARKAPGGPENPERARKGPERARIALHPERPGKGPERPGKARKGPERPGKARIGPERPGRC